jgi:hypothetical protein
VYVYIVFLCMGQLINILNKLRTGGAAEQGAYW